MSKEIKRRFQGLNELLKKASQRQLEITRKIWQFVCTQSEHHRKSPLRFLGRTAKNDGLPRRYPQTPDEQAVFFEKE